MKPDGGIRIIAGLNIKAIFAETETKWFVKRLLKTESTLLQVTAVRTRPRELIQAPEGPLQVLEIT